MVFDHTQDKFSSLIRSYAADLGFDEAPDSSFGVTTDPRDDGLFLCLVLGKVKVTGTVRMLDTVPTHYAGPHDPVSVKALAMVHEARDRLLEGSESSLEVLRVLT